MTAEDFPRSGADPSGGLVHLHPIRLLHLPRQTHVEKSSIGWILLTTDLGERLFIMEHTVRFHVTSVVNKLGANNRAQAVAILSWLGLF